MCLQELIVLVCVCWCVCAFEVFVQGVQVCEFVCWVCRYVCARGVRGFVCSMCGYVNACVCWGVQKCMLHTLAQTYTYTYAYTPSACTSLGCARVPQVRIAQLRQLPSQPRRKITMAAVKEQQVHDLFYRRSLLTQSTSEMAARLRGM